MEQNTIEIFFALLRSAVFRTELGELELSNEQISELLKISIEHDVAHLLVLGLKKNGLTEKGEIEKIILHALYRYERLNYDYTQLCSALEEAGIPFVPLKGSVLRQYYPEPWMRTSCDIDVLVRHEHLEDAVSYLVKNLNYIEKERTAHDVLLKSPVGGHIELHFDLVIEGRANNAIKILSRVWDNVLIHENCNYQYDMSDEFFYFYHIAHMAVHFENGGCGIRPFIDICILDRMDKADKLKRDALLEKSDLLHFANVLRKLSRVWFDGEEADELSLEMQDFILHGGVYGSADNRVAIQQKKKGGRIGYIFSRIFVSYEKLKRYYPIIGKHRWLMPFMQIRRWFMLLNPNIARMAKKEIAVNNNVERSKAEKMNRFLNNVGL